MNKGQLRKWAPELLELATDDRANHLFDFVAELAVVLEHVQYCFRLILGIIALGGSGREVVVWDHID